MNRARILYVDDDRGNLTSFRVLFQKHYDIQLAESAQQGLDLMQEQVFDVVLTDQRMPAMTGTEFLERVRQKYPHPFRMIVTGYSDIKAVINAINQGHIYYYFSKPWDENEIKLVIDHALEAIDLENRNEQLLSELKLSNKKLKKELKLRSQTERVLNTRVRQQESAAKISRMILTAGRLDDLMHDILRCVSETLTADSCTILQLQPGGKTLLLRAGYGWLFGEVGKLTVRTDQDSPIGLTVKTMKPIKFENLDTDERFAHEKLLLRDNGMISGAAVIIPGTNGLWGTLSVHSRREKHFSADDVHYLEVVARILADAIESVAGQESLQRSEEKFRGLLESSPDGMVITDNQGRITTVNAALEKLTGYESGELTGQQVEVLVPSKFTGHTRHRKDFYIHPRSRAMGGSDMEIYVRRKDGSEFPAEISLCPLMTDEGMIVSANIRDITERKQVFETLKHNEELLSSYFHSGMIGITISNPQGRGWQQINDTFCKMLGYSREELMRMKWTDITHPDDIENDAASEYRQLMEGEIDAYNKDKRFVRKDGSVLHTNMSVACNRNADGTLKYNIVLIQDISERKQAQEALQRSERLLRRYYDAGLVGMSIATPEKGWMQLNDTFCEMVGYTREELMASNWMRITHPDDLSDDMVLFERMQSGETDGYTRDKRFIRKDGGILHVTISIKCARRADGSIEYTVTFVQDITERKKMEQALRKSEEQLLEAQHLAHLGFWEWDIASGSLFWSDELYRLAGRDAGSFELSYENSLQLIHPDDREGYKDFFRTVLREGKITDFKHRIMLPDGKIRYNNVQAELVRFTDGSPMRMLGTVMDITDRVNAEEALRESEMRLKEAQKVAHLGYWERDIASDEEFWSDEIYTILGFDQGKTRPSRHAFMELIHPDDRHSVIERIQSKLKSVIQSGHEYRIVRPDGEVRFLYTQDGIDRDAGGRHIRSYGTIMDITDLKRTEELLRKARDELELRVEERTAELLRSKEQAELASAIAEITFANMGQGILMVDSEDKILIYNDHLSTYTGIPREVAMSSGSFHEYLQRGKSMFGEEGYQRALRYARMRESISYETVTKEGNILEVRQNPLTEGGFVRTYTDITQMKSIQEDLQRARDRAEAASIAKANFLATMSHEIRTPMNGVIGMTDLLLQSRLDDEQRQMLQTINDCGQSLLTIINDILDFSKIEAGKLELEAIPMSLTDVVEGSAQTIVHNAIRKGLRLLTYIDPTLPQFVTGDPVRLRQILINLGGNAIKFTDKGKVVIRADRVAGDDTGDIIVRFSITDEGIGISQEIQNNLFQEFTQAESSTTRRYGGTGLGLSICQRLAEMMDGEIGVHSAPGEGSEFYLTLTFKKCDKVRKHSNVSDLLGLRILLIARDNVESEIYRRYLEYWHANVDVHGELVDSPDVCRSAADRDMSYDIVVMSCDWAVEQQLEICRLMAETASLARTRYVIMKRGRRRRPRLENELCVTVDVDQMRRAGFLSAVSIASNRASPEIDYEAQVEEMQNVKSIRAPSMAAARAQGRLILVAEDNPTNRDVIRRQLNVLGYACEMAEDGRQALAAWRGKDYALLLTDCQMPNMDGFELTNAIRIDEEQTGRHPVIIAITANALQGEAERCLAAGMDDYLSKPIDLKELREKLRQWMPQSDAGEVKIAEQAAEYGPGRISRNDNGAGPIDENTLKEMFGEDPQLFKEILFNFIDPSQRIITEIENGWKKRNADDIRMAAHKLKSSARSIGADNLADLCLSLESAGKEEDWNVIDDKLPALGRLMHDIEDYINRL